MTGKQTAVLWMGLFLILLRGFTSGQLKTLFGIFTAEDIAFQGRGDILSGSSTTTTGSGTGTVAV